MRRSIIGSAALLAAAVGLIGVGASAPDVRRYPRTRSKKSRQLQIKTTERVSKAYRLKGVRP